MQPTVCPECKKKYGDASNKVSIALMGKCLSCRATEDEERWEDEGGSSFI